MNWSLNTSGRKCRLSGRLFSGVVTFARGESLGQLVPVPHGTFQGASAVEAFIMDVEPEAARELIRWREERRKLVGAPVPAHHLYRKAEGIEDHLVKVGVPPFTAMGPGSGHGGITPA